MSVVKALATHLVAFWMAIRSRFEVGSLRAFLPYKSPDACFLGMEAVNRSPHRSPTSQGELARDEQRAG